MRKSTSGEDGSDSLIKSLALDLVTKKILMILFLFFNVVFWISLVLNSDGHFLKLQKAVTKALAGENNDHLLLLPAGVEKIANSCVSRNELPLYWRGEARQPSPNLVSKLRSYEARHKRCGPHTNSYNQTLLHLYNSSFVSDCKYIVWISYQGLGNKMLTLAAAFLYALLTDRVLLADRDVENAIPQLFCDPFPEVSIFLPLDFPFTHRFTSLNQHSNQSYGYLLKTNSTLQNPYVYLHIADDYDDHDRLFFCDQHQTYLNNITWLLLKSDIYFVPSLFLMPSFQPELDALFPEKDTVFHFLGRYLLHPTNSVWGLITRYYEAYLSKADVKVGIQVRVFDKDGPFKSEQVLSCIKKEKILPQIRQSPINSNATTTRNPNPSPTRTVAVVMASLSLDYFVRVRDMYWENPTESGEVVGVFQPSHELYQQTEKLNHNWKALAEIYLLSFTDKLVTSGWSTFGYAAQGLGGLKPWIMYMPKNKTEVPDPPCGRAMSMEPCFHVSPLNDCENRRVDLGAIVPRVRKCEDRHWDLKLF